MLEQLAAPVAYPLSLATAKSWLRETVTDWDADIDFIRKAAVARAERVTHAFIVRRPVREQFDYFLPYFELSGWPLRQVTSITYTDAAGVLQTLSPTKYIVDATKGYPRVTPAYATYFPPTRVVMNTVQVYYDVGMIAPVTSIDVATGIVTAPGHGKAAGDLAQFFTDSGTLPDELAAGDPFYVVNPTATTFQLATTAGGSPITTFTGTFAGVCFLDMLPEEFLLAMRLMVGTWYENREGITDRKVAEMPSHGAADRLLEPFKVRAF